MSAHIVCVTGTNTGVGKTFFTAALSKLFVKEGLRVAALKPFETGCDPHARDAEELAQACGQPGLAHLPKFYRAKPALAPYAISLELGEKPPQIQSIVESIKALSADYDVILVEGVGGPLVPLDAELSFADFALKLSSTIVLVVADKLGALSESRCAHEALERRGLKVRALVLNEVEPKLKIESNERILKKLIATPCMALDHGHQLTKEQAQALAHIIFDTRPSADVSAIAALSRGL